MHPAPGSSNHEPPPGDRYNGSTMQVLLQDLHYSVRQLRKSPGITALVILTVALGIGVNTSVFSLLNGFLRPLRVQDPAKIVVLAAQTRGDETGVQYRFSYPALVDFRRQASLFSDVFAFNVLLGGLGLDGKTAQVLYSAVSGSALSGSREIQPAAGRCWRGEAGATGLTSYWDTPMAETFRRRSRRGRQTGPSTVRRPTSWGSHSRIPRPSRARRWIAICPQ